MIVHCKTLPNIARSRGGTPHLAFDRHLLLSASIAVTNAIGCASDSNDIEGPGEGPLYAIMYEVYDDVGSNSYLSLLSSLELEEIDTTKAREYPDGRAFIQTYEGALFVGEAATPEVTRYSVADDGTLTSEGKISFANYFSEGQFDSWNVTFIDAHKAYLMDFRQGTTIIWDPTNMEILGDIPAPSELYREGLSLEGSPAVVRDGLLFRTFNWVDYEEAAYSTDFLLGIYDVEKDELVELVPETRCSAMGNLVHKDEAGNAYFSNWIWPVAGSIMRGAPEPCVLRINAGEKRFDPEWSLNYTEVTGRKGAMFTYLGDDQALVSAFYEERTEFDETTDPWAYVGSMNWRIWSVDLETGSGAPLEGIDFNGGAFTPVQFDGRLFLMVPGGEEENYATELYEVEDGVAAPRVKLPGWSYQFVKLR